MYSVAVVSPYDDSLHKQAMQYWQTQGLEITSEMRISGTTGGFHPIYTVQSGQIEQSCQIHPDLVDADAVVLLGTGLPSLSTVLRCQHAGLPVLSANLCLLWACTNVIDSRVPADKLLQQWLSGEHWASALKFKIH